MGVSGFLLGNQFSLYCPIDNCFIYIIYFYNLMEHQLLAWGQGCPFWLHVEIIPFLQGKTIGYLSISVQPKMHPNVQGMTVITLEKAERLCHSFPWNPDVSALLKHMPAFTSLKTLKKRRGQMPPPTPKLPSLFAIMVQMKGMVGHEKYKIKPAAGTHFQNLLQPVCDEFVKMGYIHWAANCLTALKNVQTLHIQA